MGQGETTNNAQHVSDNFSWLFISVPLCSQLDHAPVIEKLSIEKLCARAHTHTHSGEGQEVAEIQEQYSEISMKSTNSTAKMPRHMRSVLFKPKSRPHVFHTI